MDPPRDLRWSRAFLGTPSTVTSARDTAGRSCASFLGEDDSKPLPLVTALVGRAVGRQDRSVLSTGEQVANPTQLRRRARTVAPAQRALARTQTGAQNRDTARVPGARAHAKCRARVPTPSAGRACPRQDGRATSGRAAPTDDARDPLIREHQVIGGESLAVKPRVRHRARAKAISEAGWGEVVRQLHSKAAWDARTVMASDQGYPRSHRCHAGGPLRDGTPR